jgi:hypothetical protein
VDVALYSRHSSARYISDVPRDASDGGWTRRQMSGPPTHTLPLSGEPENLLVRVERLRQQAEAFQRTVENDRLRLRAILDDLRIRQAKRRGVRRRSD